MHSLSVDDSAGSEKGGGSAGGEAEQQIDLGTFYKEFIRPGRGNATVTAEVADPAAKEHLARVIQAIETNRHGAGQAR